MAEMTQEQIDALVAERIAEAKKGLFTEDELTKRVTSEVDRRVESGIQKGLETQKQKWERELAEKAKLTAEELAKKEFEERTNELSSKEREIKRKANLIDAKDMLANAEIPKSQYEKVITMLVSDDDEATKTNVQNFINVFNETKNDIEAKVKAQFSTIPSPNQGDGTKVVTKKDFINMKYGEKMAFKETHPELYKEYIKD